MRLSSTAPAERGNVAAANPLPPYRGFRHQVQPRNAELATAVEIFFRTGDFDALRAFGTRRSAADRVLMLGYLLANDFTDQARELDQAWDMFGGLGFRYAIAQLDAANGAELAEVLGWAKA